MLENMSTSELIKQADTCGIDIPLGLERIFIIEEILESVNAEDHTEKEDIVVNPSYSEPVLLPKQYNISYLEVITRDPLWAFVYWEIKQHDRGIHENAVDFNGYCLHVIPLDEADQPVKSKELSLKDSSLKDLSFTVPVSPQDSARYLGFTEHSSLNSVRYIIKLCVIRGSSEILIASSKPFSLPNRYEYYDISGMNENPLIRLSGIQDLLITKNIDRQSRIKR